MSTFKTLFMGVGFAAIATLSACSSSSNASLTQSGLNPADFDSTVLGKKTELVTLKNANGMEVCLTNYGGRVVSISVPDKDGKPTDVVLGYDNIHQYADTLNSPSDYGSSVGRYANRIKDAKLSLAGSTYQLKANDNGNCLHGGGATGWLNQVYDITEKNDSSVTFTINAKDGENGFPGNVTATAKYTVKSDNTLDIEFGATTDKETVVNMTNHSYFNLNGDPSKEGFDQVMYINADKFTPADSLYIPTGEIKSVEAVPGKPPARRAKQSARAPSPSAACPANWQTVPTGIPRSASCSLWKVTPQAVPPRWGATAARRLSCPCAGKC